jgi:hypothetical protein
LTFPIEAPIVARIPHRHLKQLVSTAAALPGPKVEVALWASLRAIDLGAAQRSKAAPGQAEAVAARLRSDLPEEVRLEIAELRALVAGCLRRLALRIEDTLAAALAEARRAWDQADSVTIVDADLGRALADARRKLGATADRRASDRSIPAVALEGLLALEAACGLTTLAERRLSSIIRLRLRGQDQDLLPGGRPFLDLGAAFTEAARAWT